LLTSFFHQEKFSLVFQNIFWGIFLVCCFFYGVFFITSYTKQFNQIDHQTIVLDETVGQILPLQITFSLLHENYFSQLSTISFHIIFCFAVFRFFDITKPSFIGYCDRNFKSGFGVMFDDLLCGLITAGLGAILILAI
jgi:phosphatidylglycerophosphatase A